MELEGPNYRSVRSVVVVPPCPRYQAVFGTEFRQSVCELLATAERAREAAR